MVSAKVRIRPKPVAFTLIAVSVLTIALVGCVMWSFWKQGAFQPGLEAILAQARQLQDPSLCRVSIYPGLCLERLLHPSPLLDYKRGLHELEDPMQFSCAAITDRDLRTLCEVTTHVRASRDSCDGVIGIFAKRDCRASLAAALKDASICNKEIGDADLVTTPASAKAKCLHAVAVALKDPTVCDQLADTWRLYDECAYGVTEPHL